MIVNERQRPDLIAEWRVGTNIDVIMCKGFSSRVEICCFKTPDILLNRLNQLAETNELCIWNGSDYMVLNIDSLSKQQLVGGDSINYEILNYMAFSYLNKVIPNKMIVQSFTSALDTTGMTEKKRLVAYIQFVNSKIRLNQRMFYVPFINICQSSGSGKSKLASELLKDFPSSYVVLRDASDMYSYPQASALSSLFMPNFRKYFTETFTLHDEARKSVIGYYLLLLRALFMDYQDKLKELISENDACPLETIAVQFFLAISWGQN